MEQTVEMLSKNKWTRFMDMHSGGDTKVPPYEFIYIEADEGEAMQIFEKLFHRDPYNVTCDCCGEDYSVMSHTTLEQATAYERECEYAYFDSDGRKVSQDDAWVRGQGLLKGYSARYIDTKDSIPLDEYTKKENILIVRRKR